MRGRHGYSLSALGLLALTGLFGGVFFKSRYSVADVVPTWNSEMMVRQDTGERTWKQLQGKKIFSVGDDATDVVLYSPAVVKVDPAGNAFVLDYGDLRIKKFSPQGNLLQSYGKGKGQGPGEFVNPTDFAIADDGSLWVCDPVGGSISVFTQAGALKKTLRLEGRPYRLALRPDGGFVAMLQGASEFLFHEFDAAGRPDGQFGHFIENQIRNSIVLDGWITPTADGFLYAANRAGLVAAYSHEGVLRLLAETLDPTPLPRVITDTAGGRRIDPKGGTTALNLSIARNEFHLFSRVEQSGLKQSIVDTYREDGSYLYSVRLPEPATFASVTEDAIYTINEVTVTKWAR